MPSQRQTYADALRGCRVSGDGSMSLGVQVEEERTNWLYCSMIGALYDEKDLQSFKEEFLKIRPLPFQLTDCGGQLVIITFPDKGAREKALLGGMSLRSWFRWLKPWSNECKPGVLRDAWIKCSGLPHQLWNQENLARVGKLWGEVITGDHVLSMMSMAFGWIKVRTSALQPISQDVQLLNNGVSFRVHVTEESIFNPEQWVRGSSSRKTIADGGGGRRFQGVETLGISSQRSHVSDSRLSAGLSGISHRITAIVPFASNRKYGPDRRHLVVDSGRHSAQFHRSIMKLANPLTQRGGEICMTEDVVDHVAQDHDTVPLQSKTYDYSQRAQRAQEPVSGNSINSQEIIANLGSKGRLLGNCSTEVALVSSGVRGGRGALVEKKRKGVLVKATMRLSVG
ncbi:hypothetical protein Dimus_007975 [Dionaea muscipula]